jgi:hypothetical protein
MPDEPDPPRKFYGFKPTKFEVANSLPPNAPASASDSPTPPASDPGIPSAPPGRIDVHELNRLASTGLPLLNTPAIPKKENEVHTILRGNLAVADAAGLNDVKIDPHHRTPHQRRVRTFWILLVAINVPLGIVAWVTSHPMSQASAFPFTFAIAGIGYFTGRLIWHTFFLNTD